MTEPLPRAFFARDALVVARALVGTRIVHREGDRVRVARIVETEAYRGPKDLACHARAGLTKRTRTLFGPPGHAYVFFVYGMHECFNVVCKAEGAGHAVLVRAAEILEGASERADGPGRFARAMGLTRAYDGASLLGDPLFLLPRTEIVRIRTTPRVGVAYAGEWADRPWRFCDACSLHVSKPPKAAIGRGPLKASPTRRSRVGSRPRSGT
ncbi:MAG TPA: DNA-3-methyladenine glycosylase [Polyangiaceae bacterium]|jgi:DNA-3-methyladenine glycosylase